MKTGKLFLAIALAALAIVLMTSIVLAAPTSASGVAANRVADAPNPILTDTLPTTHPVGIAISTFFGISYTQVMSLHVDGYGFGVIARAYFVTRALSETLTPENVLVILQSGRGWGQIKKQYPQVQPAGKSLGAIMGKKPATSQSEPTTALPKVKPGNSGSGCPGNSCNAPGQQKAPKGNPAKAPKS